MPDRVPEDLAAIWTHVREELQASLPTSTFKLWIDPLRAASAHGSTLYLSAPDAVRAWVERRYASQLVGALRRQTEALREIGFVAAGAEEPRAKDPGSVAGTHQPNPAHTFDRFVIGPTNRFAHAAALSVAELPGEAYNPLFLYGPPGLGKTHLLGAIAHYLQHHHPELTVRYTTGERFTAEFVAAMRGSSAELFKQRHRELDVLLIDDVHILEDKQHTQEEFFHTFDALHQAGSQIVLSSDRAPDGLSHLTDRLRDRFEWGLCVELRSPDLRTRMTVLSRLAAEGPLDVIGADTLREIATLVPVNVRRLEGALTRVVAFASLTRQPPSSTLVRELLTTADKNEPHPTTSVEAPTVRAIQDAVCTVLHLSRDDLLSSSRNPQVTKARQVAMYLSRELTGLSLAQIAREFNRDHTTVLHAIRKITAEVMPGSSLHHSLEEARTLVDHPTV